MPRPSTANSLVRFRAHLARPRITVVLFHHGVLGSTPDKKAPLRPDFRCCYFYRIWSGALCATLSTFWRSSGQNKLVSPIFFDLKTPQEGAPSTPSRGERVPRFWDRKYRGPAPLLVRSPRPSFEDYSGRYRERLVCNLLVSTLTKNTPPGDTLYNNP